MRMLRSFSQARSQQRVAVAADPRSGIRGLPHFRTASKPATTRAGERQRGYAIDGNRHDEYLASLACNEMCQICFSIDLQRLRGGRDT